MAKRHLRYTGERPRPPLPGRRHDPAERRHDLATMRSLKLNLNYRVANRIIAFMLTASCLHPTRDRSLPTRVKQARSPEPLSAR